MDFELISDEELISFIDKLEDKGLLDITGLFIEMHRPLRGLTSVMLSITQPLFGTIQLFRISAGILSSPEIFDKFCHLIEVRQDKAA